MDKIEKPRNQLEVMFNKAVELEAENKRLRDELKGATRIIDEQDAENQRLREENAEKEACIQEDFHTLKGLENTLEEQGETIERLRGLLAELLEFRKRDDRGDPDYTVSDWWYDEVWSRVEKELSDG